MQNNRQIKIIRSIKIIFLAFVALLVFNTTATFSHESSFEANSTHIISVSTSVAHAEEDPNHFLTEMLTGQNPGGAWAKTIYNLFKGFLNIILLVVLLYVAFRNILHIEIDNYAIKKLLPKIIGIAVLGNLAWPIFTVASSLVDQLGSVSIFSPKAIDVNLILLGPSALTGVVGLGAAALVLWIAASAFTVGAALVLSIPILCCSIIIVLSPFVLTLGINLLLSVRPWLILIGAAVAPVAIALAALPQTEAISKRYLKIVGFWLFYPLLIYVVVYVIKLVPSFSGAAGDGMMSSIIASLLPILIRFGLLVWAFRLPFLWEKDVAGLLSRLPRQAYSAGKTVVGASLGAAAGASALAYRVQTTRKEALGGAAEKAARADRDKTIRTGRNKAILGRRFNGTERMDTISNLANRFNMPVAQLQQEMNNPQSKIGREASVAVNQAREDYIESHFQRSIDTAGQRARMQSGVNFNNSPLGSLLEDVQQANPGGILSAVKEFREGGLKEVEKAHYRKSKINDRILGKALSLKHQQAIQRDDQSHLHSLPDLEGNYGPNFKRMVKMRAVSRGISEEESRRITELDLQRLMNEQAGAHKYVAAFQDVVGGRDQYGNPFGEGDLANVIEGAERQRNLALQYARSARSGRDVESERRSAISESNSRMVTSGAPRDLGVRATQMTLGERRIAQLLTNVGQRVTASGANARDAASVAARDIDGSEITSDEFNTLGFQGDRMLNGISRHLQGQGRNPQEIQGFLKELREANAGATPALTGQIGSDSALQKMVDGYKTNRAVELTLLQKGQGSDARERMATMIQRQQPDQQTIINLQQQSTTLVKGGATEAQRAAAVDYISRRLNLPKDTIDSGTAENITGALESMILRDREDRG